MRLADTLILSRTRFQRSRGCSFKRSSFIRYNILLSVENLRNVLPVLIVLAEWPRVDGPEQTDTPSGGYELLGDLQRDPPAEGITYDMIRSIGLSHRVSARCDRQPWPRGSRTVDKRRTFLEALVHRRRYRYPSARSDGASGLHRHPCRGPGTGSAVSFPVSIRET